MDVGVVWRGGGAQVGSGGVVGRTGVQSCFASRGLADTVGPDLDAFCLSATGSSRELLVNVMDEAVKVLTFRGGELLTSTRPGR